MSLKIVHLVKKNQSEMIIGFNFIHKNSRLKDKIQ